MEAPRGAHGRGVQIDSRLQVPSASESGKIVGKTPKRAGGGECCESAQHKQAFFMVTDLGRRRVGCFREPAQAPAFEASGVEASGHLDLVMPRLTSRPCCRTRPRTGNHQPLLLVITAGSMHELDGVPTNQPTAFGLDSRRESESRLNVIDVDGLLGNT